MTGDPATSAQIAADMIVVAAGRSMRMDGTDKLAVEVAGRPLLAWTLDAVAAAPEVERIVVVTAPDHVAVVADASWLPAQVVAVVGWRSPPAGVRSLPALRPWIVSGRPTMGSSWSTTGRDHW